MSHFVYKGRVIYTDGWEWLAVLAVYVICLLALGPWWVP